jgi:RNA polymerase sigma-70 factor (ECF subfamily)
MATAILNGTNLQGLTDEEVVRRVLKGETALYEIIMRRYNQRLYRAARAILRDDSEAEDVLQDTYVRAYQHLDQFAGRSKFSTWLTRIAVHEALARVEKRKRYESLDDLNLDGKGTFMPESNSPDPESQTAHHEVASLLEEAMLSLPDAYRAVLVLRDVEEMNTSEAADALDLTVENVKVRLHRARALLRRELYKRAGANASTAFPFMGSRCDRVVKFVMERITAQ